MGAVGRRIGRSWQILRWTALLALAPILPAAAQTAVDLQLVLAVDASGSVDQYRFELQKRGYVAAFRHARVLNAIRSGANQAIAVTMLHRAPSRPCHHCGRRVRLERRVCHHCGYEFEPIRFGR